MNDTDNYRITDKLETKIDNLETKVDDMSKEIHEIALKVNSLNTLKQVLWASGSGVLMAAIFLYGANQSNLMRIMDSEKTMVAIKKDHELDRYYKKYPIRPPE